MKLAIRFSITWTDNLEEFFSSLDRAVVYQHDADEEVSRTHIHALVETSVSTDTLKNRLTKIIGKRLPKTDWAFTQKIKHNPVEDRFITYMSKGKLEPVYIKGFTQDTCNKYKALWVVKSPPPVASKSSNVTSLDIATELAKYITTELWDGDDPENRKPFILDQITHKWIVNKCIDLHNKYGKTYMVHSLLRVIQTAWGLTGPTSRWRDRLVSATIHQLDNLRDNI